MGKRGPQPWEPTEEQIRQIKLYAGLGMTQEQCAQLVGVCDDTLRARPAALEAFNEGKAQTIAKVAGSLVSKALAGDTTSAIFYLKTQAGWKDSINLQHGGTINTVNRIERNWHEPNADNPNG